MVIVERLAVECRNGQDGGRRSVRLIDDVITAVDVERVARYRFRRIMRKECNREPDIVDADKLAGRRLALRLLQQGIEFGDAGGRPVSPAGRAI